MNNQALNDTIEQILSISLPVDPDLITLAAERVITYYGTAPAHISLPADEVADRITELWDIWLLGKESAPKELREVVREAISVDKTMMQLAEGYFKLIVRLEEKCFMERQYAIALTGYAPLIRTLVNEQHLGLDRIRGILNIPGATFDAIKSVLSSLGVTPAFDASYIDAIHELDIADVSGYFGDMPPEAADGTFRSLLGKFPRSIEFGENVCELVYVGFEPYLFILYFELLTLERCDRFPGHAIYECAPRGAKVKALWNKMYNPTQENPYLNNAKSVYSLDLSWAETKLSRETQNGSLLLASVFDIMAELPYVTRRRVAHITRCYLALMASKNQTATLLPEVSSAMVKHYVERIAAANSLTKGVLDQRLVDFLTMCIHDQREWLVRGLGSSVNETNVAGRKYGDVEYLSTEDRTHVIAYEAHGGGLRDEYVLDHIHSLEGTVRYHIEAAQEHGENYWREVEIVYVAHDVSRLERYRDGHEETIYGMPFKFRFITFDDLVEDAGGLDVVSNHTSLYNQLVHKRISRLPDVYRLKERYCEIIGI